MDIEETIFQRNVPGKRSTWREEAEDCRRPSNDDSDAEKEEPEEEQDDELSNFPHQEKYGS